MDWKQSPAFQIDMRLDTFCRMHVDFRPVFIISTGFQQGQIKGAVLVADLPETVEVAGIAAEEYALIPCKDGP